MSKVNFLNVSKKLKSCYKELCFKEHFLGSVEIVSI